MSALTDAEIARYSVFVRAAWREGNADRLFTNFYAIEPHLDAMDDGFTKQIALVCAAAAEIGRKDIWVRWGPEVGLPDYKWLVDGHGEVDASQLISIAAGLREERAA